MYSPKIRIIISILGLYMAWNFYSSGNMTSTFMVLIGVGLVFWGYFKNGTVYLAFQQLKKENYDKAEQLLAKISKPELLKKSQKGYYHFTKGFIEMNKQNTDAAFTELSSALSIGLRTQNDTSIVTLNLASIELERKNLGAAKNFLERTKALDHKPEINAEIERIEGDINAAQQNI
jgi:predicted negative regulator of RcsB-dependent stress response